jgi:hypothetical protein
MQVKITSKNFIALTLCFIVFALGLSISIQMKKTPTGLSFEAHSTIPFVHAVDESGCATCHKQPITSGSCVGCHPSPPTQFNNGVSFPHHNENSDVPYKSCEDAACHDAGDDFRFVDTPHASHNYCDNCHQQHIYHGPP